MLEVLPATCLVTGEGRVDGLVLQADSADIESGACPSLRLDLSANGGMPPDRSYSAWTLTHPFQGPGRYGANCPAGVSVVELRQASLDPR